MRAAVAIRSAFQHLAEQPEIGRPVDGPGGLRELLISFGASGYVVLYSHELAADAVLILAFRHQKEAGY
jgi:plasmid stabilization system protein ParE